MNINERIDQLEHKLGEYDGRIRKLDDLMDSVDTKLKEKYKQDVASLHLQSEKARARLHLLKLKKAQSWEDETLGSVMLEIFDELGEKLDLLFSRIDAKQNLH